MICTILVIKHNTLTTLTSHYIYFIIHLLGMTFITHNVISTILLLSYDKDNILEHHFLFDQPHQLELLYIPIFRYCIIIAYLHISKQTFSSYKYIYLKLHKNKRIFSYRVTSVKDIDCLKIRWHCRFTLQILHVDKGSQKIDIDTNFTTNWESNQSS